MTSRRRRAVRAGYVGGSLLVLTGGTGAAAFLRLGWTYVQRLSPELGRALAPVFLIALLIAALGGFSVLLGSLLLSQERRLAGKALIGLGTGMSIIGLALYILFVLVTSDHPARDLVGAAITLNGLGTLLSIYAQVAG